MPEDDVSNGLDSDKTPQMSSLDVRPTDPGYWRKAFAEFDEFERFRIRTTLDYLDKVNREFGIANALYEKLIILDGAIIALSITWISSLLTKWSTVHYAPKPHIWMVDVSWCLLLVSIFCCYHVISRRHGRAFSLLLGFHSQFTDYIYARVGGLVTQLGKHLTGTIELGSNAVDLSRLFTAMNSMLTQEKDTLLKKIGDAAAMAEDTERSASTFAGIAIYSTIVAAALLCIFAITTMTISF